MPRDFASRGGTKTSPKRPSKRMATAKKKNQRKSPSKRVLFHGPSFSFGTLLGASIVLLGLYAPDILQGGSKPPVTQTSAPSNTPTVNFEFPDLLENSEVQAQPDNYPIPEQVQNPVSEFLIQAASFRTAAEADRLRAELLLVDLPAYVESSNVRDSTWHRVYVGPFVKRVQAERALTQLRERRLAALLLEERT